MHYGMARKRGRAQNSLTQTWAMPKIPAVHLDRLRERPLEAGATTGGSTGTPNGANSCGAGQPMPESGRWAVDCTGFTAAMGYERRRYRGYVNLYGACGTWPKIFR